ncbi:MAG: AbrB/MazE/SpoVT family DNA-binding domain-containing protein [Candidatus Helarchaeota archaeon]
MSVYYEKKSKVGKKGEIYTDKEIRKTAGLNPDDEIFLIVKPGIIIIRKIPTLKQLLSKEPLASVTVNDFEEISVKLQKESASKVIKDLSE